MSTTLLEAPRPLFATTLGGKAEGGRRATLEELLESRWRSARADGWTACPICQAEMQMEAGHARCGGCGAKLA